MEYINKQKVPARQCYAMLGALSTPVRTHSPSIYVMIFLTVARGGTSCRVGRANAPPDFDARGENRSLPSHISMASLPMVRLKFRENKRICLLVNTVPTDNNYCSPIAFRLIMVTACMTSTGGQKRACAPNKWDKLE